jgi:PncC family amidohydrolase
MTDVKVTLKEIFSEAQKLIDLATERNIRIATAESCTGGLIGAAITSISGSSTPFKGGIIAYDNAIKQELLNVPPALIQKHGAVSREVASAMAKGAIETLNVDLSVSVTGIAGPGGGSKNKPIGTVWMGLATRGNVTTTLFEFGDIGRNKVRDVTCLEALKALIAELEK